MKKLITLLLLLPCLAIGQIKYNFFTTNANGTVNPVPVANGGTGQTTATAGGALVGNYPNPGLSSSTLNSLAGGNMPVILLGTSSTTAAAGNDSRITGALQSGTAAGGALTGTYPNPTLANANLNTLAGGTATPILGTSGTTALAGNTAISSLSGTVAIANGGTGQTTAAAAQTALGVQIIANGGTGQTTAAAALTALGGASLTANQTWTGSNNFTGSTRVQGAIFGQNGGNSQYIFDNTLNLNTDSLLEFTGSPYTSGQSTGYDVLVSNLDGATPLPHNFWGYGIEDFGQLTAVGNAALYANLPATFLLVDNGSPIVCAHSSGLGNVPGWWVTGNGTEGYHFGVPLANTITTNNRPYNTTLKNAGTNVVSIPADQPLLFDINQTTGVMTFFPQGTVKGMVFANGLSLTTTNGVFIKPAGVAIGTPGTLGNSVAFDPLDTNPINEQNAVMQASNYITGASSGATAATGYYNNNKSEGINMTGGSFGMTFLDNNVVMATFAASATSGFGNGGFYPCGPLGAFLTHDNTFDIGYIGGSPTTSGSVTYTTNSQAWKNLGAWQHLSPYLRQNAGSTGAKTINFPSGSIRIAAAGSSVVLTDSFITTNSIVYPVIATHDTTAYMAQAVPATGSCTFFLNAAATAEVEIRFLVWNAGQ